MPKPTPSATIPRLALTQKEAAQSLGVCQRTLRRLETNGKLRRSKLHGRPIYALIEVERLLRDTMPRQSQRKR